MRISESSLLTSTLFDWGGDKEPVDLDRNMEDVTLVEVSWMVYLAQLLNKFEAKQTWLFYFAFLFTSHTVSHIYRINIVLVTQWHTYSETPLY
jgi:hypothetical protein